MLRRIDGLVELVCAVLLLELVLVLFVAVVFRYVLARPLGWPEEVARFSLVWLTFLGSYLAFRRGAHIHVDLLAMRLAARGRRRLALVGNLLMALATALLVREGITYASTFFDDPSPYLRYPIGLQYLALPVGGLGWLLAIAARLGGVVRGETDPADRAVGAPDSE